MEMAALDGRALIDDTLVHQWTDNGSHAVREMLTKALRSLESQETKSAIKGKTESQQPQVEEPLQLPLQPQPDATLYRLLYELVWIVLQAKLSRQDVLGLLKDARLSEVPGATDVMTDLLWVIGNEVEAKEKGRERYSSAQWQALARLVKDLAEEEIVPITTLKSSLELDLLHHAGLMRDANVTRKMLVRVNTKTLYTQMKFNLLREESEGFAKVLVLLQGDITHDQLAATKTDLMSLIGFFDLDANRVLDLVLDAYEMDPMNDCFPELLGLFKRDNIPHVLGFKFQYYKREYAESSTPVSLYRLAATLIENKVVDIDTFIPHLVPTKDDTVASVLQKMKELEAAAKSFGKVNLTAKASDDQANEAADNGNEAAEDNQVFGLIIGLLEIGAQERAFSMIKWFRQQGVDPLIYDPLTTQMCKFGHLLLTEVYAPRSMKKMSLVPTVSSKATKTSEQKMYARPISATDDVLKALLPVLEVLGAHLHTDSFLFTKIIRVVGHIVESKEKDAQGAVLKELQPLIVKCLLPALSLMSCDPSAAFQLWDLVKRYPFDERYTMYQHWQDAYSSSPEMHLVQAQCVQQTRKIMRRLTADRAKPSARSLTHIAHSNPLIVFVTILRQIQSYDNLIQPVVDAFKFVTPLGMDVLSFVLVSELSKARQSMKSDGTNISMWLASLSNFSGSFYRKYPMVELTGLLQYLIQRLQQWESVDLVVLSELLSKMGSCITFEDISESQLEAHAGGPHLWHEPQDPKLTNRRAIPRLRDALIKKNLALPLCVLICQVRSRMECQEDAGFSHLKMLGRMYDTCQMTLSQLLQFLNAVTDPAAYTKMLPPLHELVQEFHVPPELAMTMCRPAIRSIDPVLKKAPRSVYAATALNGPAGADAADGNLWGLHSAELLDDIGKAMTSESGRDPFSGMTRELYAVFWSLTLYDIYVPYPQYEAEITRLRGVLSTGLNGDAMKGTERKKFKEKTMQMIEKLQTEQKNQAAHRKQVFERLEDKKALFFKREEHGLQTAVNELLQKCIIPRALLSPEDALFCAKFMERVHRMNTPAFSTVQYYDKVSLHLPSVVLCVTEREAGNFGIFLKETFTVLQRWYQDSSDYETEAIHGKTGFSIDLNDPKKVLPHRQYKSIYAKWHRSMVLLYCKTLGSGEYMPIRNSLIVLTKAIDVFPSGRTAAECLLEVVERLTAEDREDIKIMARRYHALLTKRRNTLMEDKKLAENLTAPKRAPIVPKEKEEHDVSDRERDSSYERETRNRESVERRDPPRGESSRSSGNASRDRRARSPSPEVKAAPINDRNRPAANKPRHRDTDRRAGSTDRVAEIKRERKERESSTGRLPPQQQDQSDGSRNPRGRSTASDSSKRRDNARDEQPRSRSNDRRLPEIIREKSSEGSQPPRERETRASSGGNDRNAGADNRKRQRTEPTEDDLRRQLELRKAGNIKRPDTEANGSSTTATATPSKEAAPQPAVEAQRRKIVSLVSSRKRDRDEPTPPSNGNRNQDDKHDVKRRRETGSQDDNNKRSDAPQHNKRMPDDRKKQQMHRGGHGQRQRNDGDNVKPGPRDPSRTGNRQDGKGNQSQGPTQGSSRGNDSSNQMRNSNNNDRRRDNNNNSNINDRRNARR